MFRVFVLFVLYFVATKCVCADQDVRFLLQVDPEDLAWCVFHYRLPDGTVQQNVIMSVDDTDGYYAYVVHNVTNTHIEFSYTCRSRAFGDIDGVWSWYTPVNSTTVPTSMIAPSNNTNTTTDSGVDTVTVSPTTPFPSPTVSASTSLNNTVNSTASTAVTTVMIPTTTLSSPSDLSEPNLVLTCVLSTFTGTLLMCSVFFWCAWRQRAKVVPQKQPPVFVDEVAASGPPAPGWK